MDNCFGFDWGMDVENGSEGGGKLICKIRCICERFVIRLVGFVLRKVCDNSRARSSNEKIKGMTIIMSWKVDVLSEMEIIKDARKIARGS